MKKAILAVLAAGLATGCASQPVQTPASNQPTQTTNAATGKTNSGLPTVASSHSGASEQQQSPHSQLADPTKAVNPLPSGSNGGRSPMERAIDTAEMDAAIEKAEKDFKQRPKDAAAKTALAEAYFTRATALTEAAQYRSALGDYRRGLKLDPTNTDAKNMQDQIISIFQSLNREPPKEGTEPTPLPFKKA